ncbi:MAG: M1 family aminopeptidase [candidate division KSB1 bacterium]|nr:M1 family aminopeptidase [candidate division KSB1 bacterium]
MKFYLKQGFRWSILLLSLAFLTSAAAKAGNQDYFDVYYYELNIAIDPTSETVGGSVTVRARSLVDNLDQITLDLYDNMKVTAVAGNAAGFSHNNHLLVIQLDHVYHYQQPLKVTVHYSGHPSTGTRFNPMTFDRSRGTITISSESCPFYARCWWPCKDRPDDKPDSMDIWITAPSSLMVASNGRLVEINDNKNGTKTHHWQIRNPIATYLVAFTATNYRMITDSYISASGDTLPTMLFIFPEHYNKALVDFNNVNTMIQVLESYYGQYPYYNEKYGIAEYVGYWGGMEYQTLTSLQPYLITGNHSYDDVYVHELAHQWWGDCVTPKDFHHTWISEGFATFSEALYFGHLEGQARYHQYMNDRISALGIKGRIYRDNITDPDSVYALIVYNKGAWVLHMLRHVIGEDNFWAGLRAYRSLFEYKSATTEDLQHAFEAVVGDSLGWFFRQWIYQPGYPHYAMGWHQEFQTGAYKLKAFIRQDQTDAPLFKMPLDIVVTTAKSETTLSVMMDERFEKFNFSSKDSITGLELDRDNWVLKKLDVITTPMFENLGHQVIDSTDNNNGLAEAGESVFLIIRLINKGTLFRRLTAYLSSSDPSLIIPREFWEYFSLGSNDYQATPNVIEIFLPLSIKPDAPAHLASVKLHLRADGWYSVVDSFDVKIGNPNLLLVDDDNGATYEQYFYQPLTLSKCYYDRWDNQTQGCPPAAGVLQKYQTVIWFTGNDRSSSLTDEEQQVIREYLANGGRLLLTGQDIGYDLVEAGSAEDSAFYHQVLHADFISDTVKATMMMGISGDPIAGGMFVYIDAKAGGARNQFSPSAIAPRTGASLILKYLPTMTGAAIRYEDAATGARLVYLAFGMEGISGPHADTAEKLLNRILSWLSGATAIAPDPLPAIPATYKLWQNYPNPFNSVTHIRYCLSRTDHVLLAIYNLKGQKLKTLVNKTQAAGVYELRWDGTDDRNQPVAAGIYLCRLAGKSISASIKIALIK